MGFPVGVIAQLVERRVRNVILIAEYPLISGIFQHPSAVTYVTARGLSG